MRHIILGDSIYKVGDKMCEHLREKRDEVAKGIAGQDELDKMCRLIQKETKRIGTVCFDWQFKAFQTDLPDACDTE